MNDQYKSKIKIKKLFGTYSLYNKKNNQKYYLNTLTPEDPSNYMVKFNITINKKLFDETDIILVCCKDKEVFRVAKIKYDMTFMFPVKVYRELTIKYIHIINNGFIDKLLFRKVKGKVIKKQNIYIDDIKYPKFEECSICLKKITNNVYKSECNHIFHQTCIVDYIKFNKYCQKLDSWCSNKCCHGDKVKPFPCPYCSIKTLILMQFLWKIQ